jgi:hypothetical protein
MKKGEGDGKNRLPVNEAFYHPRAHSTTYVVTKSITSVMLGRKKEIFLEKSSVWREHNGRPFNDQPHISLHDGLEEDSLRQRKKMHEKNRIK